jgi:hypothetical protein
VTVNVSLNASLTAQAEAILLNPSYTFATPVLGGQLTLGMVGVFGRVTADINGTLTTVTGPIVGTRMGSIGDSLTSVGDLYPMASLKWNAGVHNFMTYVQGDIPVGAYDPGRLANLGIGHGAVDGGGGYTYFNPQSGQEFSIVSGLTYNLKTTTRSIRTASTSISIGACRNFSPSRLSSAWSDTATSRSPTTPGPIRSLVASARACSASVRSSDTFSRSATCRATST